MITMQRGMIETEQRLPLQHQTQRQAISSKHQLEPGVMSSLSMPDQARGELCRSTGFPTYKGGVDVAET
jgi:hypothetical protein